MALNSFQKFFLENYKGKKVNVKLKSGESMNNATLMDADVYQWLLIFQTKSGKILRFISMNQINYMDKVNKKPEENEINLKKIRGE